MSYTIYDLYNFEDQIEPAVAAVLAAALAASAPTPPFPITCAVVTTRSAPIKTTPRIEVSFSLSQAMTQRTAAGQATPRQVPNAFEGTLAVLVATTRPIPTGNADLHGTIRGLVRFSLSAGAKLFSETNLPLIQILEMLPEAQTPRVYDPKGQDLTLLNYHVWFAIRNGAWPATS